MATQDSNNRAKKIVDQMYDQDAFSQWLGIERILDGPGVSKLRMVIREEMVNGFGIAHGGISFSFADSAFAFASNSQGKHAVSIETSISHLIPLKVGDVIFAEAIEQSLGNRIAIYEVRITKESGELAALFKGTVYRKNTDWEG